jgi:hypothetical protein
LSYRFKCGPGDPGYIVIFSKKYFHKRRVSITMDLVLQRFDSNGELSVEECVMKAVEGMEADKRLELALELVGIGMDREERLQEVVTETWKLILREEWWKVRYVSLVEFMNDCGMSKSVKEMIEWRLRTERLKRKFESEATQVWGVGDLKEILGEELIPNKLSKGFLEAIRGLAKQVGDAEEARELLLLSRDRRLGVRGASNDEKLRVEDVRTVIRESKMGLPKRSQITIADSEEEDNDDLDSEGGEPKSTQIRGTEEQLDSESREDSRDSQIEGSELEESESELERVNSQTMRSEEAEESESLEEQEQGGELTGNSGWGCRCAREGIRTMAEHTIEGLKGKDLKSKLDMLARIRRDILSNMCYRHFKAIASKLELQTQGMNLDKLFARVEEIMAKRERIDELLRGDGTYLWFRRTGRPQRTDDRLGPFKHMGLKQKEFLLERKMVWERYGGVGAMEKFLKDGNIVVREVFDWIIKDPELMVMVDTEFDMYRHHLREQNGMQNYGWCRNMWHSLVQQVMRQDPVLYALNVATRPDGNWRLVSFPYYTKYAQAGDSTGFKRIDINVPEFLNSGRGGSIVQSAISLDEEYEDSCTIVVPGFQCQVGEWWNLVKRRGQGKESFSHGIEHSYSNEDERKFGRWVPVVCKGGDLRLTLGAVMHGSIGGCQRRCRVIYPWLVGVDSDHENLDMTRSGTWEDVCRAHRNMCTMRVNPTGESHGFGVGYGRFAGAIEIRGVSAIGDALVGGRRWDSRAVLKERDIILSGESGDSWRYIRDVRGRMKEEWKRCFRIMMEAEVSEFGDEAYFKDVNVVDILSKTVGTVEGSS